ncbi:MAG: serine--tRNA ligase [Pseudomonadota bacterium]
MFDIKYIRDNPKEFDAAMARRKLEPQSTQVLKLDEDLRAAQTAQQTMQQERNEKSSLIGQMMKEGKKDEADQAREDVARLKEEMIVLDETVRQRKEALVKYLSGLPNILKDDVPDGADEDDNAEIRRWFPGGEKEPRVGQNAAKEHYEIGEALGFMDFETAAKLSGSRFVLLKGPLARLERALAQFMLDTHVNEHGLTEASSPLIVNTEVMYGTGQLPKFEDDQYETTNGQWLIPTSEVTLTNTVREDIVDADSLPHRYTAYSPCFRKEAGSAGKDTRGMLRQHQFYKVEMVSITHPDESADEHERMLGCAQAILEKLEIPYRTVVLCSGDTGFGARKTYDIEAWLPGQNAYREISSVSVCGDFQARRMNARFKAKGDKNTQFVHTLNGSGVAVGRALIAVMENYYDPEDGGIIIPEALKPYMGGLEKIVNT